MVEATDAREVTLTDEMQAAANASDARLVRGASGRLLVHGASAYGDEGATEILKAAQAAGHDTNALPGADYDAAMTWEVVPGTETPVRATHPEVEAERRLVDRVERSKDKQRTY